MSSIVSYGNLFNQEEIEKFLCDMFLNVNKGVLEKYSYNDYSFYDLICGNRNKAVVKIK
ncbi:MAG TPA: hypothetical protein PLR54_05000 [Spirochaetota bacterium]|nr:hypothetical protein [Spirochaetota bacterium]HOM87528.1 hypothetical protein [Spirochaetota bacterium]HOR93842.1 hypothetical protein [Spirochaetota bacterium]HOT19589.1 hypothetical protein [Spirochaetota bacterium]HQG42717.1 hypothetical protein [Spirochaetota bacterium]